MGVLMVFSCILTFRFFICLPDKQFFVIFFLGDQKWPLKSCSTLENERGWKVMWLIMSRYLAKISYLNFVALGKITKILDLVWSFSSGLSELQDGNSDYLQHYQHNLLVHCFLKQSWQSDLHYQIFWH